MTARLQAFDKLYDGLREHPEWTPRLWEAPTRDDIEWGYFYVLGVPDPDLGMWAQFAA